MASAYDAFSNGGIKVAPFGIERIRTAGGRLLYEHGPAEAPRSVIGQPALAYMIEMMRQVLISGTGGRARVPGYDLAGKTGTTSDYKDAWFVGYTGGFTAAVWLGRDDDTPMKRVTGGAAPAEVWRAFMAAALPRLQSQPIPGAAALPTPPTPTDAIGDVLAPNPMPARATPAAPAQPGTQPPPTVQPPDDGRLPRAAGGSRPPF